uniref:Hypothetical conserved protein n=1 Tax=uncultured Acidobacteriota bacterium TaxID=171953 RepID=H5SIV7_9BACT|nr:hypothetical conserved protein [uncultured Acidobacteriota bacterium]
MRDGRRALLWASGATLLLWFAPYAEVIVYPVRLFVTLVHESAHALAAVMTGGSVAYIQIHPDGSGVTATRGGLVPLISSAGYVGTVLYGSALLLWCRDPRRAKTALGVTALGVTTVTLAFIRPVIGFGFAAGVIASALFGILFWVTSARAAQCLVGFLAVQSCLNALFDLKALFALSIAGETHTDARAMQELTRVPALVWALLWSGVSLVVLVLIARAYRRTSR